MSMYLKQMKSCLEFSMIIWVYVFLKKEF